MIHQALMKTGQWDLRLRDDTPKTILDRLNWQITPVAGLGHIAVFPTRIDPRRYPDATLLSMARYVGVLLEWRDDRTIAGPGPAWWLGEDADHIIETEIAPPIGSNLSTWMASLVPTGTLTAGTYGGIGALTARYQWVTYRTAIDDVCRAIGAEWRIRGLTIDANTAAALWPTTDVVIARNATTRDITVTGIPADELDTGLDLWDYVTKIRTSSKTGLGTASAAASPYKNAGGVTVSRVRYVEVPESEDPSGAASSILARALTARRNVRLSSDIYDIGRDVEPGETVWVYDPDRGLVDAANKVWYNGRHITPLALRVYELTWPIRDGMGVAFRNGDGAWTDLTDWVEWETGATVVDVGAASRSIDGAPDVYGSSAPSGAVEDGRWIAFAPQFDQGASSNIAHTVNSARWRRIGSTVHVEVDVTFTAAGTAGAGITMTVPINFAHTGLGHKGCGFYYDTSAGATYKPAILRNNTARVSLKETGTDLLGVTPNFAVASGDLFTCSLTYEAAL